VQLSWSYTKGIPHNSNKWAIIGIRPIIHVPLPPQNGTWECGYLVVEYFNQYLDKHGNREHYFGVEVSFETCYHHIFTTISNLFGHCILLPHGLTFGAKGIMRFSGFPCFNGVCGFHVSSLCFCHVPIENLCFYFKSCFKSMAMF
jgi:hypothetical protein